MKSKPILRAALLSILIAYLVLGVFLFIASYITNAPESGVYESADYGKYAAVAFLAPIALGILDIATSASLSPLPLFLLGPIVLLAFSVSAYRNKLYKLMKQTMIAAWALLALRLLLNLFVFPLQLWVPVTPPYYFLDFSNPGVVFTWANTGMLLTLAIPVFHTFLYKKYSAKIPK